MESAAPTLKRVTLELGGNDAAIVMPDVDVEKVAEELFWAAFRNNGQICVATKRMYVNRDIYEPLKDSPVPYARTHRKSVAVGTVVYLRRKSGGRRIHKINPCNALLITRIYTSH